jgi:Flp pilus assembly pilin Flp
MNVLTLIHKLAARLSTDDKGAILAEYGLLAVAIATLVAAVVWALGDAVLALYDIPAPF